EPVSAVRQCAVAVGDEPAAAEREAIPPVVQGLAARDDVSFADETEAVARILRRGDIRDARDAAARGADADAEAAEAAGPEERAPTVPAGEDLDPESATAAGEHVAAESERRAASGGDVHLEAAPGTDPGGDRIGVPERTRPDQDVPAVA